MYRLFIAEKPSVAREFAKALGEDFKKNDGFMISVTSIVTWCVGHLITMSYPEVYDPALKKWSFDTIPFIPEEFKYEPIPDVKKQFDIVSELLNRKDVDCIYICTDSGREGEYIYRLVDTMAHVPAGKTRKRVWIDSQTEDEIKRGIREAKDWSEYDTLSDAAYLRAKEDFLMGINFSRALTLKYGYGIKSFLGEDKPGAVSVGRVMTCVLGMVVRREREIRNFDKTPYYRILGTFEPAPEVSFEAEWRATEGSRYFESPLLYKENGFKTEENANKLIEELKGHDATVSSAESKKEKKKAPLLFNLAELQNECSKLFKISPDKTLEVTQSLYEKKLVTYPRTDARVLSTAVAKEIGKNLKGLSGLPKFRPFLEEILKLGTYKTIEKTQYTNDKMITDHYAIIPTGDIKAESSLDQLSAKVYELIVRRFLSIFYPPAEYLKVALVLEVNGEKFYANFKALEKEGYLAVARVKKEAQDEKEEAAKEEGAQPEAGKPGKNGEDPEEDKEQVGGLDFVNAIKALKKGTEVKVTGLKTKPAETKPPVRYNSGSLIIAMEGAGKLIEDEELRAQIKGSGIGTSATRGEILKKLFNINYLANNSKTQIVTPTLKGEMVYDVVDASIKSLLNPELTASWEKGLDQVVKGTVSKDEYMEKLSGYVTRLTNGVKGLSNMSGLNAKFREAAGFYKKKIRSSSHD